MVGLIVIVGSSVTLVVLVVLVVRRAHYPNGIASFSPGLRSVRYPG